MGRQARCFHLWRATTQRYAGSVVYRCEFCLKPGRWQRKRVVAFSAYHAARIDSVAAHTVEMGQQPTGAAR